MRSSALVLNAAGLGLQFFWLDLYKHALHNKLALPECFLFGKIHRHSIIGHPGFHTGFLARGGGENGALARRKN